MPKIQITQQRTQATGQGAAPNARGERVISGFAEGAPAIQRGLGELDQGYQMQQRVDAFEAKVLDDQKENDAIVGVSKILSDAQLKWQEHLQVAQNEAAGDANGFTPKILTDFDKYAEETTKNAPTEKSKKYLTDRLNSLRTSIGGSALTFEATTRRNARLQGMSDSIDTRAKLVQDNPTVFTTAMAESMAEIDALALPPDEKLKLKEKLSTTLPYAAMLGRIMRDPKGEAGRLKQTIAPTGAESVAGLRASNFNEEFGNRPDGSPKGKGFLGVLQRPDGGVMTEYSVGVNIGGKEVDIPTLVPTLTKGEVQTLLSIKDNEKIPDGIMKKAVAYAKQRTAQGKPVFAQEGEQTDLIDAAAGSAGQFDKVMDFIFKKEGGYNANDGNGPVNFGINQAANPDIDVKNLTKAGAKDIYMKRYWSEIDGDQLSPGVALMAMDAAVNQGVGFAKKMLEATGGDIDKMQDMRAAKYAMLIAKNPERYAKYEKTWNARLSEAKNKADALGGSGVRTYSLQDAYDASPDNVRSVSDPAVDALSFTQRIQLIQQAETMSNQNMALAREQLRGKLQDFGAAAQSGVAISPAIVPTVEELQAAHGDIEGLRMFNDDVKPMLELNGDLRRMSTMPIADRALMLQSKTPTGGSGFADAQRRHATMQQADDMLRKEMETDPSAYAMKYSDTVKTAFDALQRADSNDMMTKSLAAKAYVTATLAEQKRIGVSSPTILPKALTDNIVRQFYSQDTGGGNAATLIHQQSALWGDHWPAVYGQMSKDLPSSALVIGTGLSPQTSEMLARASVMKQTELEDGLVKDELKTMKSQVQSNLTEFQVSLAQQPGGMQMFNTFNEQITKLSTMYMRMGESPDNASKKAYDEVVGSKYQFVPNANNKSTNYRVPVEYDMDTITDGADKALSRLTVDDLPDYYDERMRNSLVQQEGYWITDPRGERGLVLYANGAVVKGRDGAPIFRMFDELFYESQNPSAYAKGRIRKAGEPR